jgi:ubiquinone/menaquinone biosynthesis C-methylase UbiE
VRTSRPISFDRVADLYDGSRGRPREVEQEVGRRLAELLGDGRTLDIGIGTGRVVADLLRQRRPEVIGVDVSRRMIRHAVERGAVRVLLADGRALPFRDGVFDRTMSTHLLHLVADWPTLLREVTRVTRRQFVSVLEYETSQPDPTQEYLDAAKRAGESTEAPGLSERTLAERLPPDLTLHVTPMDYRRTADAILAELEARSFRGQWAVSPPVHDRIMSAQRSLHVGRDVAIHLECKVVAWEVRRLREFADAATTSTGGTGRPSEAR